jgi:hypothetical protein
MKPHPQNRVKSDSQTSSQKNVKILQEKLDQAELRIFQLGNDSKELREQLDSQVS